MKLIPIDQVVIPTNRFRKAFSDEAEAELRRSIQNPAIGLLHLPIVRGNEIVTGERRYRAIKALYANGVTIAYGGQPVERGLFPCLDRSELDPAAAREVELQENTARLDLSWQERAAATKALFDLRREQNPNYEVADLNAELGYAPGSVTATKERIIIAEHLDQADVSKAATENDAKKALKRSVENEVLGRLAMSMIETGSVHILRQCSFDNLLASVPPFDVLLADPPYGQNATAIDANMKFGHRYEDDWKATAGKIERLAGLSFAKARAQAHAYVFCNITRFMYVADLFEFVGWNPWPRPLIWHKDVGHIPAASFGPKHDYECIMFANKGSKPVMLAGASSILHHDAVKSDNKQHAAEKPVSLLVELLQRSCIPSDIVVDPFCGSGPVFTAASQLGLVAWGCDIDAAAVGAAKRRMMERTAQESF